MSGPSFTEGNWGIDPKLTSEHSLKIVVPNTWITPVGNLARMKVIAEVLFEPDKENSETQANAHLIKPAPDMFEALKGAEWAMRQFDPNHKSHTLQLKKVQAVLAKAQREGQQFLAVIN